MPQTFVCLQCVGCRKYQVQQQKASMKFYCTLCGQQQSVKHVHAISNKAQDIRKVVQELNELQGAREEAHGDLAALQADPDSAQDAAVAACLHRSQQQACRGADIKWAAFADKQVAADAAEDEATDAGFVTALPDGHSRARGQGRRKHGSSGGGTDAGGSTGDAKRLKRAAWGGSEQQQHQQQPAAGTGVVRRQQHQQQHQQQSFVGARRVPAGTAQHSGRPQQQHAQPQQQPKQQLQRQQGWNQQHQRQQQPPVQVLHQQQQPAAATAAQQQPHKPWPSHNNASRGLHQQQHPVAGNRSRNTDSVVAGVQLQQDPASNAWGSGGSNASKQQQQQQRQAPAAAEAAAGNVWSSFVDHEESAGLGDSEDDDSCAADLGLLAAPPAPSAWGKWE